jgi:hypothetical protein
MKNKFSILFFIFYSKAKGGFLSSLPHLLSYSNHGFWLPMPVACFWVRARGRGGWQWARKMAFRNLPDVIDSCALIGIKYQKRYLNSYLIEVAK